MADTSTGFYPGFIDFADEIIDNFSDGKTALITKTTGTADIAGGEITSQVETTQTVPCVRLPANKTRIEALDIIFDTGSTVKKRFMFLLIAGKNLTFDLAEGQKANVDGDDWTIIGATPLNPNVGDAIMWSVALQI